MTRRPIHVLVNPTAGGKPGSGSELDADSDRLEPEALADVLRGLGLDVSVDELGPDDDAAAIARRQADDGSDIVVAGGDGTVSVVAAALVGHADATLGILATGSYNNMARGYGIPLELDAAMEVIGTGRARQVDCGWVVQEDGGRPFFEAAGVGIDAIGFIAVELAERHGWLRAARGLWRGLKIRRTPMRITIDDRVYRTGSPAVTVSNGPFHGPGFAVPADADPTDGRLDVAVFHGMSRLEVIRHFAAVARRRERPEPRIVQYRAARVTIEGTRRSLLAHADGESIGMTPVTFEIRPGALRIFR